MDVGDAGRGGAGVEHVAGAVGVLRCRDRLGGVGLSSLLGAVAAGAAGAQQVVAIDLSDDRLQFARELGATATIDARAPEVVEQVEAATRGGVEYAFESTSIGAVGYRWTA